MKISLSLMLGVAWVSAFAAEPFGEWITSEKMARMKSREVESRQHDWWKLSVVDSSVRNQHILFRKSFDLAAVGGEAKLRITADDYYKLYINGKFVGQGPAAGFPYHYFYDTHEVTQYLRPGKNVIAVHTYYQGLVNRVWVSGDGRHGMMMDLAVDDKCVVRSDETFKVGYSGEYMLIGGATVGYQTQFLERYNAASMTCNFERMEFDDSKWENAVKHPCAADYSFYPSPIEQLQFEDIRPVSVKKGAYDRLTIDFGAIYVGGLEFAAQGPSGKEILIRCGQELNGDGTVRYRMRCNCDYQDEMLLSGGERDILHQFDYKSFRYAELVPAPGVKIDEKSIVLKARHLPFVLKQQPTFTDPRLAPIWKLCVDSFKYGVQEQIQDCMDREKGYYLGDGCYTMYAYCKLTGKWYLARKFFEDFLRTRRIDRGLVTCGNCAYMQEIAEYPLMLVWFAERYLKETGDKEFLREHFAEFADILDAYRERYGRKDGLVQNFDKWNLVEWPMNFQDGYDADLADGKICTDLHNVINAWYIQALKSLNVIAASIGNKPYADVAPVSRSFQAMFYDRQRHLFVDREGSSHISLPGNTFAAFADLAPADDRAAFHAAFCKLVDEKRFKSISMFQFVPLFDYLQRTGEKELLTSLILDPNAWLRNLREGATRTFEGWGRDTKWNTSLFHLTIASVTLFL